MICKVDIMDEAEVTKDTKSINLCNLKRFYDKLDVRYLHSNGQPSSYVNTIYPLSNSRPAKSANDSLVFGISANACGFESIAIGNSSYTDGADGMYAVAVGYSAIASGDRSVALGSETKVDRNDCVSVGSDTLKRYISNVQDPIDKQDAATKNYVDNMITYATNDDIQEMF